MVRVRDVMGLLDQWYPPSTAHDWDRVGLTCGDPEDRVRRVLLAVDPAPAVAAEAEAWDADLLVTHHPLLLRGVSSVAATSPKGRTVHRLVRAGCALHTAHTNADVAEGGVNEAMAAALGLRETTILDPDPPEPMEKLAVYVPLEAADVVREALADAGAGAIGDYDRASWQVVGEGRFRPGPGARPHIGTVGELEVLPEVRVEVIVPVRLRARVVMAMLAVHPYEEVAYDLYPVQQPPWRADRGIGRVGELPRTLSLRDFAAHVAGSLPPTARGVAAGGDPDRPVRRVALCSGAGDSLLDLVRRTDADVYVTSDLRHHPASEFLEHADAGSGLALVDVSHWAAEWTWLPVLADRLTASPLLAGADAEGGDSVEVRVSTVRTDPWTVHAPSRPEETE